MESIIDEEYQIMNRVNTPSVKWGLIKFKEDSEAFLMGVADMDLHLSKEIRQSIMKRVQTIHLGYALVSNSWREAIVKHVKERYLVEVTKDQLVDTLGIVQFVHICMDMFTKVGDGVLLLTPSYFPVYIKAAGRKCYESKLVEKDKRFWINFEEVEAQLSKPDVRILILVSPHNPCGRIWSLIQMKKIADIIQKTNKILISDELFADHAYGQFHSFLEFAGQLKNNLIVCNSPSKVFNVSGSLTGYGIFQDLLQVKDYNHHKIDRFGGFVSKFSQITLEACYADGEKWCTRIKQYFQESYRAFKDLINKLMPRVLVFDLESSYLVLLDFKEYGTTGKILQAKMNERNLFPMNMHTFMADENQDTTLFRVNIGCNREYLLRFVQRLAQTFNERQHNSQGQLRTEVEKTQI